LLLQQRKTQWQNQRSQAVAVTVAARQRSQNPMQAKHQALFERILAERERQKTLPGSEWDSKNSVNDWIAIASHYLTQQAKRKSSSRFTRGVSLTQEDFEDDMIKAAAVILAALEHSDILKDNGELS
jgi:hypothetical protein